MAAGDTTRYSFFPTVDEFAAACAERFDELARESKSYEFGDRCPTLFFRRRAATRWRRSAAERFGR